MKYDNNGRYEVLCKALKTGEWYPKTRTDSFAGASSVFSVGNFGRAMKLIDHAKNIVLKERDQEV